MFRSIQSKHVLLLLGAVIFESTLPFVYASNTPLRVASFNVENGLYGTNTTSYQDTARILKRLNADVVGLCELMVTNGVGDNVNFPILASELGLTNNAFDSFTTPHRAGIASRYPIAQVVWVYGSGMTRRIPLARIDVPGAQHRVWVAMVHLKSGHTDGSEQHKRAAELFWLRKAILANCNPQNDTIVLMGDFNLVSPTDAVFAGPGYSGIEYPLYAWKDANGYFASEQILKLDAKHAGTGGETYTWRSDGIFPNGALDHMMVSAPVRALGVAAEVYDIKKDVMGIAGLKKFGARPPPTAGYGSDHLPIFADIKVATTTSNAPFISFALPQSGVKYTLGSAFYLNAEVRDDIPFEEIGISINGVPVDTTLHRCGNTIALPIHAVHEPTTQISAYRSIHGIVTETAALQVDHFNQIYPLPVVEMLPLGAQAGGYVLLRARAYFPAAASGDAQVRFYANGVFIGTGRSVGADVYELTWRLPDAPISAQITASASAIQYLSIIDFGSYYGSTISPNSVALNTAAQDDVTLAAGRTSFEPVVKSLTWPEAHADAIASGGRLAVFPTGAMYDRVIAKIRQTYSDALWLGLTDRDEEGVWRWIDGSPLAESRWNTGEPNNYNGDEDYAHVWWGGTAWNDNSGQLPAYLIEKLPLALASLPVRSGGVPWYVETNDSADAKDSAKVMTSHGGSAWREYNFTGPAEVRFQWKVSSQSGDSFSYSVDGTTIKSISGEVPWTSETVKLLTGAHTIRWTYQKDAAGSAGADAGFLDCLEFWQESGDQLGVQLDGDGVHFGVWAPNATAVSVLGDFNDWSEQPLNKDSATGYWSGSVMGASAGQEYQYLIRWPGNETGRLKNDPRADWIRNGHSVIYDHTAFDWGADFSQQSGSTGLVYELHIGTFNNPSPKTQPVATFDDAIQRLDYLQQLGVEIIALMPVTEYDSATSWGYNPSYLFAVENDYGGPDGLKRFIKAAHARGMKVQLDIVHNHYNPNSSGLLQFDGPGSGADGAGGGIYFYGDKARGTTPWGLRPNFSQPEVRRYVSDNARHWLEKYRIDGFRWDAPKYILGYAAGSNSTEPNTLLPEAKSLMTAVNRMIHEQFPGKWSIAEEPNLLVAGAPLNWGQIYLDAAVSQPIESFDGHWQYGFYDSVQKNLSTGAIPVSSMLSRVMNYSEPPAIRVIFTDTHDLAGDLNNGLRWPHRVGEPDPQSKLARKKDLLGAVLALTAPGSPMLLMGQEFHATGAFGPQPLRWWEASRNYRIFRAYQDLAKLRRDFASVRSTAFSSSFGSNDGIGIGRYWRGNDVIVAFNTTAQRIDNELFTFPAGGEWFVRINTDSTAYGADFSGVGPENGVINVTAQNNRAPLSLGPYSAIVFTRTPPSPATDTFVYGFKHIDEANASDFLVESSNMRKFSEWQSPPTTYWGPAVNDADGTLTYKFTRPGPILSGSALVNLASFNFGPSNQGASSVWVSRDGQTWVRLLDNPVPAGLDSYKTFDNSLPTEVLGGCELWLQVRLRTTRAPLDGYSTAQFSRSSYGATANVFEVRLQSATGAHEDADNDGLPDSWETITGATNPDADDDGDGLTNMREFISGLDPKTFNPDAVVGSFNGWNPTANPLAQALGEPVRRGHMQYFNEETSGQFRWLFSGIFYGGNTEYVSLAPDALAPDGAPLAFHVAAGNYLYFTAGINPTSAQVMVINPAQPVDAGGDGMDDRWQIYYGITDPAADNDGDGLSNLSEFHRGSNPVSFDRAPALVGNLLPLQWNPDDLNLRMSWSEKRQRWEWTGDMPAGALEFKFAMGPGWLGDNHGRSNTPGRTDTTGGPDKNILADITAVGRYRFGFNEMSKTYEVQLFPRKTEWREKHNLDLNGSWANDADLDGASDILEYALGGDPNRQDAQSLVPAFAGNVAGPMVRKLADSWILAWIENTDPDLTVAPEITGDLKAPSWSAAAAEISQDQTGVPATYVRKFVRVPAGKGSVFLRLRVGLR